MRHVLLCSVLLWPVLAQARETTLTVGEVPPAYVVDKVLQAPAGTRLPQALKGRAAVVEVWATWCEPCVDAIPHFNALQKEAADLPVTFVSITDEPEGTVTAFLKRHPIHGVVGLTQENVLAGAWGVESIPTTVLLDAQGRVAAVMEPFTLSRRHLEQLVAGGPVNPVADVVQDDALVRLAIWRAGPDDDEEVDISPGHVELRTQPLAALVAYAWNVPAWAVDVDPSLHGTLFHLSARNGQDDAGLRALVRQALPGALGVRCVPGVESRQVAVLRKGKAGGAPAAGDPKARSLSFTPAPMAAVADTVADVLHLPVVDETGLGLVEVTLHNIGDAAAVERDLKAQLGVVVKKEQRKVNVVKVRR